MLSREAEEKPYTTYFRQVQSAFPPRHLCQMSTVQLILLTFCTKHHSNLSVCSGRSNVDNRKVLSHKTTFDSKKQVYTVQLLQSELENSAIQINAYFSLSEQ